MAKTAPVIKVRYEDFCSDPAVYKKLKTLVECAIRDIGELGRFNATNPKRVEEYAIHGDEITTKRVARWHRVRDKALRSEVETTFDLMPDYCDFREYGRER